MLLCMQTWQTLRAYKASSISSTRRPCSTVCQRDMSLFRSDNAPTCSQVCRSDAACPEGLQDNGFCVGWEAKWTCKQGNSYTLPTAILKLLLCKFPCSASSSYALSQGYSPATLDSWAGGPKQVSACMSVVVTFCLVNLNLAKVDACKHSQSCISQNAHHRKQSSCNSGFRKSTT